MADQFCYICGDVGYPELIVTCSKCKVVSEHLYCMPIRSHDVPKFWLCGNCTMDEAKSPDESELQVQHKLPRHAKTSKVKFLPAEEVIKLSSGGINGPSKLNTGLAPQRTSKSRKVFESSTPRPLIQASKESQEQSSVAMPPKVCGAKKQAVATCLPPVPVWPVQTLKKVKLTDIYACSGSMSRPGLPVTSTRKKVPSPSTKLVDTQKQKKDALMTHEMHKYRDNTGKEVPSPSTKLEDTQKQRKDALLTQEMHTDRGNRGKEVPSSSTKLEDTQEKMKDALITQEMHTYRYNRGKVPSSFTKLEDTQEKLKDALMAQEIFTYRDYLPSLYASWKGGFQFVDTRLAGEFYDGFQAKAPCLVHGRAYELSRKIPPILQVKLLSRSDIWDDLFHNECPNLADIALYFFPSEDIERSRKNNSYLFKLMEREDLLIRSLIDGAELVVFTSTQLDLDSQNVVNRLNAECFLFGVFRAVKDNRHLEEFTAVVPMLEYGPIVTSVDGASRLPLLECTPKGHGEHDEGNAVDKDIARDEERDDGSTGGNATRNSPAASKDIDSTIQRLLVEFGSQKPREFDVDAFSKNFQIKNQEPAPNSANGSHSLSLSKVKTEPLPVIKVEESGDKKCLETEHCSRKTPTFSIDSSQNRTGLLDQDVPKRVADKYLQLFNAGIKKERR